MKKILALIFGLICLAAFLFAASTATNKEIVWFLLPLGGLFRQIAGTWHKAVGRYLPPIAIAGAYYFFIGFSWWILPIIGAYLLVKTLPVSFIGDGIRAHWFNWVWIWILGLLNGLACLSLAIPLGLTSTALILSLVPSVVYGTTISLSNIRSTDRIFVWKFVEFLMGASMMIPPALLIQQYSPVIP